MGAFAAPKGLIAELITPFESDGAIDIPGLKRLAERVSPHVQGLFIAGPRAGEGHRLTLDQKLLLLEEILLPLNHLPISLFFWITGGEKEETLETALALQKRAKSRRDSANLFFVDTPLLYHSNRGLARHYKQLCSLIDSPLILHNDPDLIDALNKPLKRSNIRTAIVKELCELEGIKGIIFSGSIERERHYQTACRKNARFRIYDGDEMRFLDYPSMSGVVSLSANLAPKAWGIITRSSLQQMDQQYQYPDHLQQIWEIGDCLRTISHACKKFPVEVIKTILGKQGIIANPTDIPPNEMLEASCLRIGKCMENPLVKE